MCLKSWGRGACPCANWSYSGMPSAMTAAREHSAGRWEFGAGMWIEINKCRQLPESQGDLLEKTGLSGLGLLFMLQWLCPLCMEGKSNSLCDNRAGRVNYREDRVDQNKTAGEISTQMHSESSGGEKGKTGSVNLNAVGMLPWGCRRYLGTLALSLRVVFLNLCFPLFSLAVHFLLLSSLPHLASCIPFTPSIPIHIHHALFSRARLYPGGCGSGPELHYLHSPRGVQHWPGQAG